jgi:ABC-type glutathione transport system ATPase component
MYAFYVVSIACSADTIEFYLCIILCCLQAEGLSDGSVAIDDNPAVDVERKHATTYTTTWLQKMKNNRVRHNSDYGIDMVRPSGDIEQPIKENSLDDACFDNYALVTAQTKHFYQLDKSKLVGRHADEGGIWALRDLSIALEYGECFGLLGPNGAGKSTLISILSGILKSTSGFQFIGGQSLQSLDSNIHTVVGFCPQFDVVWDNLSG